MNNNYKIAIAQHSQVFLNLKESIEKAIKLIKEAVAEGANIVAFPESWLPGYPVWLDNAPKAAKWDYKPAKELYSLLFKNSIEIPSVEFNLMLECAEKNNILIVLGANERSGKSIYNSMIFIKNDGTFKVHRKFVPTYTEKLVWGRGDGSGIVTIESEFGEIGGLICWEHWMPLLKAAMYSKNEYIHIAQWPSVNDLHLLAARNYAFEGKCYVAAAGSILMKRQVIQGFDSLETGLNGARDLLTTIEYRENDYIMNGGSCVIGPDSKLIREQVFNNEQTIIVEIDRDFIFENVMTHEADGHYSRPDIFKLSVDTEQQRNVD